MCRQSAEIAPDADVAVEILDVWPDATVAARWSSFVRSGGTLICFLRPGIEQSWFSLPADARAQLEQLLPSAPLAAETADASPNTLGVASLQEPLLSGLADKAFGLETISVLRVVPFATTQGPVTPLLIAYPADPRPGLHPHGLLYRRLTGAGTVYTFATLPDSQYTNLPTHPLFLPLLVRMALPTPARIDADNVELGQPIALAGKTVDAISELRLTDPLGAQSAVGAQKTPDGRTQFVFSDASVPGLYRWHLPSSDAPIGLSNVQLPASESDLVFASPEDVIQPGDNVVAVHSVEELQSHVGTLNQPQPHWSPIVAALLILLCVEAFMASTNRLWKTPAVRA